MGKVLSQRVRHALAGAGAAGKARRGASGVVGSAHRVAREACAHNVHAFWPDSVDLLACVAVSWPHVLGHRQVTDTYLLALAVKNRGRLVSFDRLIAPGAVAGARAEHLVVIQS